MWLRGGRGGQETVGAVFVSLPYGSLHRWCVCESQYPGRVRKLREDEMQRAIRWHAERKSHYKH